MSKVRLLVGTRKGAFILTSDGKRERWDIAETLAGDNNPAGRLPVTFYKSVADLPPFDDYSMRNRTYRYFTGQPLFPFGFGLSYSQFSYTGLELSSAQLNAGSSLDL